MTGGKVREIDSSILKQQMYILIDLTDDNKDALKSKTVVDNGGSCANNSFTMLAFMDGLKNMLSDILKQLETTGEVHYKEYEED